MYKLMLVDDEADVREGVIQEVDWASLGFEVVATAENGKEAAELLDKAEPDVVVTDISMPFMDGLQLSETIRSSRPMTKIIILTGFDEFEYAQQAVKLHIDEYLLKPFSSQEFIDVLRKVKRQIDEETASRENIETLQEYFRQSLPVLRQVFLSSLMTRKLTGQEIEAKSESYRLPLGGHGYVVTVFRVDAPSGGESGAEPSVRIAADKELLQFAVYNIAEEVADKHERGIAFILGDDVVLLTVSRHAADLQTAVEQTAATAEEIRQSVEKYLKCTITAGIGSATAKITEVKYSYESALQALNYRLVLGSNRTIRIGDVETGTRTEAVRFDELKQQALTRTLKVGTAAELSSMIDEFFKELHEAESSVKDIQIYLLELVTAMLKVAKDAGVPLDEVFGRDANLFARIDRLQDLEAAKRWTYETGAKMMSHIAAGRQSTQRTLIEQAKEYVKLNYSDPDISIQKLCDRLHISAGYFSSIFKKETKVTFVTYLQQVRMEAAKELLRATDLKTFEIAEQVGYADPNYFSFSFKKLFGISPKDYRNGERGTADA
ncbi:response regulator [Paenibacillus alkalitolerans]|uniref:response regulator n=1 Tax=Paenibacillus alkalitolerans TaxID=2799335 RepID=UPI0018F593E3|nr:response regulator [Paenibacillus alkalitolerans]